MCSKSKYLLKIAFAEFRIRERLSRKLKNFVSVSIELAGGLDNLRPKKFPLISFSLTVASILDRLEKPVLLFAIFHFAAFGVAGAFEGLDNMYLGKF